MRKAGHQSYTHIAQPAAVAGCVEAEYQCLRGHIVDVVNRTLFDGEIKIHNGIITQIDICSQLPREAPFIVPGFVDAHVHIESSMMLPREFARVAMRHGTVGVVCDPHEIANVLGMEGVELMIQNASALPFHFAFGAPSCVPSCGKEIETGGSRLDSRAVDSLLRRDEVYCLSEMMNYPGVLAGDEEVLAKIEAAKKAGKPVDGHAPGLVGEQRRQYAAAGISTDHECSGLDEAREAVSSGMYVLIREGSAAKNYRALAPLLAESPDRVMFCTDDSHPTDLLAGHINRLVSRALSEGYDLMDVLQVACVNPVRHYALPIGLLQVGDPADFICLSDITPSFRVLDTYLAGRRMAAVRTSPFELKPLYQVCEARPITEADLVPPKRRQEHVIVATDGSLLTGHEVYSDLPVDCQKLVCYNRYVQGARPAVAYIRGFHIDHGAIAQTIAHDSHNIVAVGSSDSLLCEVINRVIGLKGGIVATDGKEIVELPLPIAGLLSPASGEELAEQNVRLEELVKRTGCTMQSPFITLGFMSLPVIPDLKLTDKGLFDGRRFAFVR